MVEEVTEANLVRRILEGIQGEYYPNAYFLYQKLPKAFRVKYIYWDILKLFHELEWDVKIIEIDNVSETQARDPWRPGIGIAPGIVLKKIIRYRIRPEFAGWNIIPGLFDKILENLHQEDPTIEFSGLPSSPKRT
jgi:hypothetical protein